MNATSATDAVSCARSWRIWSLDICEAKECSVGAKSLSLSRDDPGHVLLEFIVVLALNQIMSPLNGENDMDVNLCVGVGHNMPLLRSFRDFDTDNYKDHAPTEHAPGIWPSENLAAA
jgi:hypothetical protein